MIAQNFPGWDEDEYTCLETHIDTPYSFLGEPQSECAPLFLDSDEFNASSLSWNNPAFEKEESACRQVGKTVETSLESIEDSDDDVQELSPDALAFLESLGTDERTLPRTVTPLECKL